MVASPRTLWGIGGCVCRFEVQIASRIAKRYAIGLDLGLKSTVATSDGEKLESGHFYRNIEQKVAQAQRRGHKHQAKRLHRTAARRRKDALHKFSRRIVDQYQHIVIGDVSIAQLVKTRMAKSVLDSAWGMLKTQLQYKGRQAGRSVQFVSERYTTLDVRIWMCSECGGIHDRDINAARNILSAGRCPPSVSGNGSSMSGGPPNHQSDARLRTGAKSAA